LQASARIYALVGVESFLEAFEAAAA